MAQPVKILGPNGRPVPRRATAPAVRPVRGRYDAAQTSTENAKHWAWADGLSARAANSPDVRKKLRERARYEACNNSYCRGLTETLANDLIGTGPRLQVMGGDAEANARVADAFDRWACWSGLAEKLRVMAKSKTIDGEAFALLRTNRKLPGPVKLDLRLVEADQVTTPYPLLTIPGQVDGVEFDADGNPTVYHLLEYHPGDPLSYGTWARFDEIPAELVLHWFRCDRPGQARGVPDVTPALPLFAQLRRYTLAVLAAAETAADFAAVLTSQLPPDSEGIEGEPFETLEITKRMMTTLPAGYQLSQLKAEQPATTYEMFKRELLNEIARCLNVPYNVAAGNSSSYNYSSGRLDHQVYHRMIWVTRCELEHLALDRIFEEWAAEVRIVQPDLMAGFDPERPIEHAWFWDGFAHVDPLKEAQAQEVRLRNGMTSPVDEAAAEGYDWRARARREAEARAYYAELGIPYPGDPRPTAASPATPPTDPGSDPGEDGPPPED